MHRRSPESDIVGKRWPFGMSKGRSNLPGTSRRSVNPAELLKEGRSAGQHLPIGGSPAGTYDQARAPGFIQDYFHAAELS